MGVVGFLVRGELRRHRARIAGLALLVALAGGIVTASVLGASRSRSSLERFITEVNSADVGVFTGSQDDLEPLVEHPDVARVARFSMPALFPTSIFERVDEVFIPFAASLDGAMPYDLNGYRILDGRLPHPDRATELALHESTADLLDVGVGDQIEMAMFSDADLEHLFDDAQMPERYDTVPMDVVAIMRDPLDVIARPSDIVLTPLTPAAAERFVGELGSLGEGAFVDLHAGTDVGAFTTEVAEMVPDAEIERWVGGQHLADTGFGSTLDVIGDSLLALAVVVAIGASVAVGQALVRSAHAAREERAALSSLGLDRRALRLVGVVPGLAVAALGGLGTALVAYLLSPRFPVGLARRAEPDPGFDLHPGVVLGGACVVLATTALAVGAVATVDRRRRRQAVASTVRVNPDPIARVVGSADAALARSTQVAVAFGALAVAAALVFATSLDHLLDTPRDYGWTFDAAVVSETNDATLVDEGVDVAADPAVAEAAEAVFQLPLTVDDVPLLGYAIGDGTGDIGPVVARGRAPATGTEVALGRETMRQLDVGIGEELMIDGGAGPEVFEVVGQAVIPVSADGGRVGNGAAFVTSALPSLGVVGPDPCEESSCYRQVVVRWRDGADVQAAADRMLAEESAEFVRPVPPPEVERLSEVDAMPWIVAGVLAVLACAAAVHAVVVTVQRRRRDLAVVRALGATPAQTRRAVRLHVLGLVALWGVAGSAVGVVVGRTLWRAVAASVGVAAVPTVPLLPVLLLPLAALVLTQAAAVLPARSATRLRPTQALRTE